MTSEEFNKKYATFLEKGHYGLAINDSNFIEWLDKEFQEFIKNPEFSYSQIKVKFGFGRFYAKGISNSDIINVQNKLTSLYFNKS